LAAAQGRGFTLAADAALEASGLLRYVVPRFALKHGIRPKVVTAEGEALAGLAATADAVLAEDAAVARLAAAGAAQAGREVFHVEGGAAYAVAVVAGAGGAEGAQMFADWLASEIGQRTVGSFAGPVAYVPGTGAVAVAAEVTFEGDAKRGEELVHLHCARCHVVSRKNRMGGIGSTPSFPALRALPSWREKFEVFWTANPHPVFLQVEGITPPFDPNHPPHVAPVHLELEDVDAILAYVQSIEPLDLGAPIELR